MHSKMNEHKKTIAIKGGYGFGNFGDDALMFAAYEIAKRVWVSESVVFHCKDSDYIQQILPGVIVVPQSKRNGKDVEVVVYGGGTQFYSFPFTTQRGIRFFLKRIVRNVRQPVQLVQKVIQKMEISSFPAYNAKKMAAIGIGLGPFVENCDHMPRIKKLFTRMNYIAVRDVYSYQLCKEWGCDNVSLCSDLCYLPGLWRVPEPGSNTNTKIHKMSKVGIIPRDWLHTHEGDSYVEPLFEVVDELRSAGKEVEFILFSKRSDDKWANRLMDKGEQVKLWNPEKCTISEFVELLSSCDVFITTRYHGAVFASILEKPVVCIEVEQKLNLVANLFGNGARLWTYPFNASKCLRHLYDLEGDYSRSVECLANVVEEQGALAEKMIDECRKYLTVNSRTYL